MYLCLTFLIIQTKLNYSTELNSCSGQQKHEMAAQTAFKVALYSTQQQECTMT